MLLKHDSTRERFTGCKKKQRRCIRGRAKCRISSDTSSLCTGLKALACNLISSNTCYDYANNERVIYIMDKKKDEIVNYTYYIYVSSVVVASIVNSFK